MSLTSLLAEPFRRPHEQDMFRALHGTLENRLRHEADPYLLIGNPVFNNCEPDALLFGPSSITVIELKHHSGSITFSENGQWTADGRVVKGGNTTNPLRQVRASRYELINWFNRNLPPLYEQNRALGHISAAVVFADEVTCDSEFPPNIKPWFHITGLPVCADLLVRLRSRLLNLTGADHARIRSKLGLSSHPEFDPEASQIVVEEPDLEVVSVPRRVVMLRESNFTGDLAAAREQGGNIGMGALQLAADLKRLSSIKNPLTNYRFSRIEGVESCLSYEVTPSLFLAAFVLGDQIFPMAVGNQPHIDEWSSRHTGTSLVMNSAGRLVLTSVDSGSVGVGETLDLEEKPFFERLEGFDLSEHVEKSSLQRMLKKLGPFSTEEEINDALDLIGNPLIADFLRDLIRLLSTNNIAGARTRIALQKGEACPATDLPPALDEALASGDNVDVAASLDSMDERDRDRFFGERRLIEWITYPHPDQKRIANQDFERPVVLEGVSGSGKTCILIHRARYLANKYPGERIGVLTLNRALAGFLGNLVAEVCNEEERKNIVTVSFYDYFASLLKETGLERYFQELRKLRREGSSLHSVIDQIDRERMVNGFSPERNQKADEDWYEMLTNQHQDLLDWVTPIRKDLEEYRVDSERYLHEEITLIRSALAIPQRQEGYLDLNVLPGQKGFRTGRGIPLRRERREDVLHILTRYEEFLLSDENLDTLELTQALIPSWREIRALPPEKRFRCLLVDEFQDLSTLDLRLLTHVPTLPENGLFLAGDTVQKILVKKTVLGDAGLGQGSSERVQIKKNFRNSRQILEAASRLANHYGQVASKMGEEVKYLDPELAERVTTKPIAVEVNDQIGAAWELVEEMLSSASDYWNACIVTADPKNFPVAEIIRFAPEGIEPSLLSGDYINKPKSAVISTLGDIKGFEFKTVIVVGLDEGSFPAGQTCRDEIWRDALRLYVAMTRACDHVYLLYSRTPSVFLDHMRDEIRWDKRNVEVVGNGRELPPAQREKLSDEALKRINAVTAVHDAQICCEEWFCSESLEVLRALYKIKVGARMAEMSFQQWLTPSTVRKLKKNDFFKLRNVGRKSLATVMRDMNEHGVTMNN